MARHEVTFPIRDEAEILKLRAGDEVTVQGHIIGIRDRTQIRIFDQGVPPPMDLGGAFLLHTAPNVRKVAEGKYEKICIGTTTSARMVRFTEGLGAQFQDLLRIGDRERDLVRRHQNSLSYSTPPSAATCALARRAAQHW